MITFFCFFFANFLRENRANFLQNFRKSGTPRAQRIACTRPACAPCAYNTTSPRDDRVIIAFGSEKEIVQRRDYANFASNSHNSRERIAKFPKKFGAPRAQKLRQLGQRGYTNRSTSLQLLSESLCVLMQDNARVQRRDDANFAQKPRENFAKFPEIRHAPRTKIACTRPACAAHTSQRR